MQSDDSFPWEKQTDADSSEGSSPIPAHAIPWSFNHRQSNVFTSIGNHHKPLLENIDISLKVIYVLHETLDGEDTFSWIG